MWWFFKKNEGYGKLKEEVKDSFTHVKEDFGKVGEWIKHLDGKHIEHTNDISEIKEQLLAIHEEINEIKNLISFFKPQELIPFSKQFQTGCDKQSASTVVQTPVQTAVQIDVLGNLTVMERGIIWALVNSDMKLSYEDLAALLGKDKSTIRGQINAIKQKNSGLIEEFREITGKKRIYIPDEIRNKIVKNVKVRVNTSKKGQKVEK